MNSKAVLAFLGFLLQLVPLALLGGYLFLLSKPPDNPSGHPGVAAYRPPGMWYVYPLSIALGLAGLVGTFSRIATLAAAVLTLATLAYGLRLWIPGVDGGLGSFIVALSAISIAGAALRVLAWRRAGESQ